MSEINDLPFPEEGGVEESFKKEITVFTKDITKRDISEKSEMAVKLVNDGAIDSIDMYIKTKALKDVCDEILDGIKPNVEKKLYSIHKDDRVFHGVSIQLTEGAVKYSFAHSEEWNNLNDKLEEAKNAIKSYEKLMIQAINSEIYDANGVKIEPAVESSGSAPSIRVIIPK